MKTFVYQTHAHECGFACLKMLLAHLYHDSRFLYLPHPKHENNYSLFELKELAKPYGLLLAGYLHKDLTEIKKEKTPFILVKTLGNGSKHALLIKRIGKHFTYLYDPEYGKRLVRTKKLFRNLNNGMEVLVVENFIHREIKLKIPTLVSAQNQVILVGLETVSILCYFFSAIFISPEWNMIYPIVIISLGIIFAIIYRAYTYTLMKRFDEKYIIYTYQADPKARRENYELMHNTKSGLFSNLNNIVLDIMSALAVNTILILNNYYSIYIIVTSLVLVILGHFLVNPFIERNAHKVERLETRLFANDLDKNTYLTSYTRVKEKSYKTASLIDLKRLVSYFVLLMMTFLMSEITHYAHIEFIIYNFAMCLFTYTCLEMALKGITSYWQNGINKTKFYDLIINTPKL
ncbi:MAG: cysteine peptidase family C39 domain-containing protein [Bacilli bacterium]|nr:cysteine peptidase family C39 domain-containing protein [Bacilli bacterium]